MRISILCFLGVLYSVVVHGQQIKSNMPEHELNIGFTCNYARMLEENFWGGGMEILYYYNHNLASGLSFDYTNKYISNKFGYAIGKPFLSFTTWGWANEICIYRTGRARINMEIINGVSIAELSDYDETTPYTYKGTTYNRPKEVAANYYYTIEPGLDIAWRFFTDCIYMNLKAKYLGMSGSGQFGSTADFSNCNLALGLFYTGYMHKNNKRK